MRIFICAVILCVGIITAFSGGIVFATTDDSRYDALKRFSQILDLVERYYVEDVPHKDLMNGAIKGMLQDLDPHSTFLSTDEFKEMQEATSGEFFGIGIEIMPENGHLSVVSPIEDTPAHKAGLKAGDIILAVDGTPTLEMTTQEAVSRIRGPKGSEVTLLILQRGAQEPREVVIERDAIPLLSVKSEMLEPGYAWIRLTRFSERTTADLLDALKKLNKKTPLKGIVLDLRNNPGGLLDQAVSVSDVFLRDGTIVSIRGRDKSSVREFNATSQETDVSIPVVVLVNAGSASASEIVAGALQDHKRGLILGENTFGKGSVQNVIPLSDGSGLKLTVALYYTPEGRSIQAEGIVPDIIVPLELPREEDGGKQGIGMMREKDLFHHLENGKNAKAKQTEQSKEAKEMLEKDNQLRMALQFAKQLPVLRQIQ